ncbi:Pet127-domain-containing protein [Neolentinus lepideus HHB14362 ss-1]|uniref:Pet127-domain-containing protein n=1 Tax=Neolentinus lepideus HHB14362 ss-1 TaxID=1314782 RepID=A0A165R7P6_9AGAM|nr:Pet127-domain-containing protein [Neolentinus lepideus HHB14362 ss-1]
MSLIPITSGSATNTSLRTYSTKKSQTSRRKSRKRSAKSSSSTPSPPPQLDLLVGKSSNHAPWEVLGSSGGEASGSKDSPGHIPQPLTYLRRIEDILQPVENGVLKDLAPVSEQRPIARLAHGLERVLFNHGVYWLQEPRSQVYNFTPWLQNIPNVKDFAFERITGFVKSSRDEDLWALVARENRVFAGSTSSITGLLSHLYFLISGDRPVDLSTLSQAFRDAPNNFTPGSRWPALVLLNHRDGRYAIDSLDMYPGQSETNILSWQGHMLEKLLTTNPSEFKHYIRSVTPEYHAEPDGLREAYRYSKSRRMVMRSQLDCMDPRLPGTGIFDLKTRAAISIRMDQYNYEESSGYMIRSVLGQKESFEKEYYDLIRSAFLKYSYQARIGNMDGVLVAYHNTARIFGFQYVPLEEMEERLYGGKGRGARVFERCVSLLEMVLPETTRCFPGQSVKLMVEAQEGKNVMNIWVQPADWNEEADGPAPTVQLDVTAKNFIDGVEVPAPNAIAAASSPIDWSVRYSISHMALRDEQVQYNMNAAKKRMFKAYSLPSGIDIEAMEKFWNGMSFGGKEVADQQRPFDPALFREPDHFVQTLRERSRAGREYLLQMEQAAQGKPKVVVAPYEEYKPLPAYVPPEIVSEAAEASETTEASGVASPGGVTDGSVNVISDADSHPNEFSNSTSVGEVYQHDVAPYSSSETPDGVENGSVNVVSDIESPFSHPHGFSDSTSVKEAYQHDVTRHSSSETPDHKQPEDGSQAGDPRVVNAVPDFETATGEVNPESSPVPPNSPSDSVQERR